MKSTIHRNDANKVSPPLQPSMCEHYLHITSGRHIPFLLDGIRAIAQLQGDSRTDRGEE